MVGEGNAGLSLEVGSRSKRFVIKYDRVGSSTGFAIKLQLFYVSKSQATCKLACLVETERDREGAPPGGYVWTCGYFIY